MSHNHPPVVPQSHGDSTLKQVFLIFFTAFSSLFLADLWALLKSPLKSGREIAKISSYIGVTRIGAVALTRYSWRGHTATQICCGGDSYSVAFQNSPDEKTGSGFLICELDHGLKGCVTIRTTSSNTAIIVCVTPLDLKTRVPEEKKCGVGLLSTIGPVILQLNGARP
jgi:hypothetical protein